MELTHDDELQGYMDAISAMAVAIARQVDATRFVEDLKALSNLAEGAGHHIGAAVLDEIVRGIEVRVLLKREH